MFTSPIPTKIRTRRRLDNVSSGVDVDPHTGFPSLGPRPGTLRSDTEDEVRDESSPFPREGSDSCPRPTKWNPTPVWIQTSEPIPSQPTF